MSTRGNQSAATTMKARNWIFTWNNPLPGQAPVLWEGAEYLIYQKETGAQGTPHFQGYVRFKQQRRLSALKQLIETAHWEPLRGTHEGQVHYCSKPVNDCVCEHCTAARLLPPPTEHTELGSPPQQGKRSDLIEIQKKLDEGKGYQAVFRENFSSSARYSRFFKEYARLQAKPRDFKTIVTFLHGQSGAGKTSWVLKQCEGLSVYWKPKGKWWDDYDSQDVVIMDEWDDTWWTFSETLNLFDKFPLRLESKNGHVIFNSKHIYITNNSDITTLYNHNEKSPRADPEKDYAFLRRIENIGSMARPVNGVYQEPVWSKRDGVLVVPTITPITSITTTPVEPTRRRRIDLSELSDYHREDYPKADEQAIADAKRRRFNNRRRDDDDHLIQ